MAFSVQARRYYQLIKPGIVMSNGLTAAAGFLFAASQVAFDVWAGFGVLAGTMLVIASACVINNIIDRKIDIRMERTKKRSLVTGEISIPGAVTFAVVMGVLGFTALALLTNWLTFAVGVVAYVFYIVIYGYAKRTSEHGTLVGSVPGALPPVAGYTALTNQLDVAAFILFLMLVTWQMAHFYAIAIYRRKEYARAKVPILTVVRGNKPAMEQMIIYIGAFLLVSANLTVAGYTGALFAVVIVAVGALWLIKAIKAFNLKDESLEKAARKLFRFSLLVNLTMCAAIAAGGYLP